MDGLARAHVARDPSREADACPSVPPSSGWTKSRMTGRSHELARSTRGCVYVRSLPLGICSVAFLVDVLLLYCCYLSSCRGTDTLPSLEIPSTIRGRTEPSRPYGFTGPGVGLLSLACACAARLVRTAKRRGRKRKGMRDGGTRHFCGLLMLMPCKYECSHLLFPCVTAG